MDEVVPPDEGGIPIVFKCPGFQESDGLGNFLVLLSTTGDVDESGLFTPDATRTLDARADDVVFDGVDTCRSWVTTRPLGDRVFDDYLRPEVSGGQLFWQVWTTEEVLTPVGRFTIAQPQPGTVLPPERAYADHAAVFTYKTDLETFGATATLERLAGDAWIPLTALEFQGGRPRFVAALPRGTSSVRVTLGLPSGPLSAQPTTVHVRRARHWRTGAHNNGRYRVERFGGGVLSAVRVSAKVSHQGRIIQHLRLNAKGLCISLSGATPQSWIEARLSRIRIAPDGSFAAVVADAETGTEGDLTGRVGPRRVGMRVDVTEPGCTAFGWVILYERSPRMHQRDAL